MDNSIDACITFCMSTFSSRVMVLKGIRMAPSSTYLVCVYACVCVCVCVCVNEECAMYIQSCVIMDMYMHCIDACMHVCMYVCVYVYIYIYIHVCMYVCMYVCITHIMHVCVCVQACVW